jgi:hypothetical protein
VDGLGVGFHVRSNARLMPLMSSSVNIGRMSILKLVWPLTGVSDHVGTQLIEVVHAALAISLDWRHRTQSLGILSRSRGQQEPLRPASFPNKSLLAQANAHATATFLISLLPSRMRKLSQKLRIRFRMKTACSSFAARSISAIELRGRHSGTCSDSCRAKWRPCLRGWARTRLLPCKRFEDPNHTQTDKLFLALKDIAPTSSVHAQFKS